MSFTNAQLAQQIADLITFWAAFNEEYANWLGGSATGGPGSDGNYPLTDYTGTESLVACPAKLGSDVDGYVALASASEAAAAASAAAALSSESAAAASAVTATAQAVLADADRIAAELAETGAVDAKVTAIAKAAAAVVSAAEALASEQAAAASEAAAAISETNAAASAAAAATFDPALYYKLADSDVITGSPVVRNAGGIHIEDSLGVKELQIYHDGTQPQYTTAEGMHYFNSEWGMYVKGSTYSEISSAVISGTADYAELMARQEVDGTNVQLGISGSTAAYHAGDAWLYSQQDLHLDAANLYTYTPLNIGGGVKFGSTVGGTTIDVSKHIDLYGGTYGISVTSGAMNFVRSGTRQMYLTTAGMTISGELVTTSGDSTQWDAAYGWGDHSGLYAPITNDYALTTGDTFTGGVSINNTGSQLTLWESDGADTADKWVIDFNSGVLNFYFYDNSAAAWKLPLKLRPDASLDLDGVNINAGSVGNWNTAALTTGDTFTGAVNIEALLTIKSTEVQLMFEETDAALNEKRWRNVATGGVMYYQAREDSGQAFANPTYLKVTRTATTLDAVDVGNSNAVLTLIGSRVDCPDYTKFTIARSSGNFPLLMESTNPYIGWKETDAAVDEGGWMMGSAGGDFYFRAMLDSGSNGDSIFTVNRTGSVINNFTFNKSAYFNESTYLSGIQYLNYDNASIRAASAAYSYAVIFGSSWTSSTTPIIRGYGPSHGTNPGNLDISAATTNGTLTLTGLAVDCTAPFAAPYVTADGSTLTTPAFKGNKVGHYLHLGDDSSGSTAILGSRQHTDAGASRYGMYLAYDCVWDETAHTWSAIRTTTGRKWKMEMGYHTNEFHIDYYDGTVTGTWAESAWSRRLTVSAAGSLTMAGEVSSSGVKLGSNGIERTATDDGLRLYGGSGNTGANIEIYGPSHATQPSRIFTDADIHYWRPANGSATWGSMTGTQLTVGNSESYILHIGGNDVGNTSYLEIGKGYDTSSGIKWIRGSITDSRVYVDASERMIFTIDEGNTLTTPEYQWHNDGAQIYGMSGTGQTYHSASLGDRISLYDERFDATNMYGFGVESGALYYKSPTYHRWYVNANADLGVSSYMILDSLRLDLFGDMRVNNHNAVVKRSDSANATVIMDVNTTANQCDLASYVSASLVALMRYDPNAKQYVFQERSGATVNQLILTNTSATFPGGIYGNNTFSGSSANSRFGYQTDAQQFTYDGDTLAHYGMSTYNEAAVTGVVTALSGYSGLRFFRGGTLRGGNYSTGWEFSQDTKITGDLETTGNVELGHASDTTLSRLAAGKLGVEGQAVLQHAGSYTSGEVTFSTSAPTGGSDGDIWYEYT